MVRSSAEVKDNSQTITKPHLAIVPNQPPTPILRKFETAKFSEGAIASRIGTVASKIKETTQAELAARKAANNDKSPDYDAGRRFERLTMATVIFKEFGMLDDAVDADFATAYLEAEKTVEIKSEETATRKELIDNIQQFENHPVLRAANSITLVTSQETPARADAIEMQRAAALLLQGIEDPDTWNN